jgi:hypothetical protein
MPGRGDTQRATSKYIIFENFEKMNTQSVRQALSEKELSWLENLQPIAPNNLTTVPGPSPSLTSISATIYAQYFANINNTDYIMSFTQDGSLWATNIATAASSLVAGPSAFTNPDLTTWESEYVLINDPTSSYAAWNGTVYVQQGGVSPVITITNAGTGYTSVPTVTITGGSGHGATAVATIQTPSVDAVNVINGGSGYSASAPSVVFSGGGGTGAAAFATADPQGITSTTVTNSGEYTSSDSQPAPTVAVILSGGGGSGASLTAAQFKTSDTGGISFWAISSVNIVSSGTGYSSPPSISFSITTPGGGIIHTPTATCTVGNGRVLSITVTSGGGGYTSAPSVTLTGGSGSGATAAAVIGGSGIATVALTNPGSGYLASDVLTVTFSGGGGTGAAASVHVWPFVTGGTTLAVFQGRVFLGGNRLLQYTGTGGFDDFSAGDAAGALTIGDADLTHAITALRNYNNYLFIMGDQSVKQIGNISLNSSGNVTLFTILTLSSDQGTIYKRSCGSFNRVFMFANTNGVYAVFGSSVQKISDDMDGIFKLVDFTQQPQFAIADFNNIHNAVWLVRYVDPLSSERSILLTFTGKKWFVCSQGSSLTAITTASTLASGMNLTYATSGPDITQILSSQSVSVNFKIQTSLSHHGNPIQRKASQRIGWAVTGGSLSSMTVEIDSNESTNSGSQSIASVFTPRFVANSPANVSGIYLGGTMTGAAPSGTTFTNITIEYVETNVGNQA